MKNVSPNITSAPPGLDVDRLNQAVAQGVLEDGQAKRLVEFWSQQDQLASDTVAISHADAEEVRFVRGFHDVFIAIGIVVFLFGLTFGLRSFEFAWAPIVAVIAIWGLSEIFARRLRLALPSFLLSVVFTPYFFIACLQLIEGRTGSGPVGLSFTAHFTPAQLIVPTLIGTGGAVLHYLRFKVPVGLAMITSGGVFLAAILIEMVLPDLLETQMAWFILASGLICFLLAMLFDMRDLKRVTVNSDKAFWLHLLAAPMIVHSLLVLIAGNGRGENAAYAILVIGVFLALALVAIIVDRRAILVSGLGYFGIAIGTLMAQAEVSQDATLAATLVLLGCFILLLGSAWHRVRGVLISPFLSTALMRFVPAIN